MYFSNWSSWVFSQVSSYSSISLATLWFPMVCRKFYFHPILFINSWFYFLSNWNPSQPISKYEKQMAIKDEKWWMLLTIRLCYIIYIKTTLRFHLTSVSHIHTAHTDTHTISKPKPNHNPKRSWRGCGGMPVFCWWECKFSQTAWKSLWNFFKTKQNEKLQHA